MDYPRLPPNAFTTGREPVDGELHEAIRHGLERVLRRPPFFRPQSDLPLPMWNIPQAWNPLSKNIVASGYRLEAPRTTRTRAGISAAPQNKDGSSTVDEQSKRGEADEDSETDSTFSVIDTRTIRHHTRIEAVKECLEPMLAEGVSAVVLLCWGKEPCSILPVPVSTSEDEVETWRKINTAWYKRRGLWRKFLPGFGVVRVETAEVTMLGLKEASKIQGKNSEYIGACTVTDLGAERKRLQDDIDSSPPTPGCNYSPDTGIVHCSTSDCPCCLSDIDPWIECPLKAQRAARREIEYLDTLGLMRHAFSNPDFAAPNDFLKKGGLVYGHQDILNQIKVRCDWHCPGLRELKFRGIVISEGWTLGARQVALPLVVTMLLLVVIVARFLFGWDTAWTVGGYFVALVTLIWMWATHLAS